MTVEMDQLRRERDAAEAREARRSKAKNFAIGALAIGLGPIVVAIDLANGHFCFRDSISHHFYEPTAGTVFVMILAVLGGFLLFYEGERVWDRWVAILGGLGVLTLAYFPTYGSGCTTAYNPGAAQFDYRPGLILTVPDHTEPPADGVPFEGDLIHPDQPARWVDNVDVTPVTPPNGAMVSVETGGANSRLMHRIGTATIFLAMLYFSGWAFRRGNDAPNDCRNKDGRRVEGKARFGSVKRNRNRVYLGATIVMVGSGLLIGMTFFGANPKLVFWGELGFLSAFGVSWLTKSKVIWGKPSAAAGTAG